MLAYVRSLTPMVWGRRTRAMATAPSLEFAQRHVSKGVGRLSEDVIEKGEGSWLTFRSGRTALDFTCGIGVTNLGTLLWEFSSTVRC